MKKIITLFGLVLMSVFLGACGGSNLLSQQKTLSNYHLEIDVLNNGSSVAVTQTIDYINSTDQVLEEIRFHLYPTAFREGATSRVVSLSSHTSAYYDGESFGTMEILSVEDKKNQAFAFEIGGVDENILVVPLNQKLYPREREFLKITFTLELPKINHRFGIGKNTINLGNFFPIACVYENGEFIQKPYSSNGDPFYSEMSNFSVIVNYPKELVLASTGVQLSNIIEGETKISKINALVVRDFALVLSNKFSVKETTEDKVKVMYYYYDDENADQALDASVLAVRTFSEKFGQYPYATLSVVKTSFVHGGMEFPNLVYISDAIVSQKDYINVIVHEIAHQWWYSLVGSNAYDHAWQDEGLTDYSTAMFYEFNPQFEIRREDIVQSGVRAYSFYIEAYSALYKDLDTSMSRSLTDFKNESEYVYIAYVKGMLFFDTMRSLIGDKAFFGGLKLYFKTYQFKNATPEEMLACFEKTSNKDLEGFFDSWVNGKIILIS